MKTMELGGKTFRQDMMGRWVQVTDRPAADMQTSALPPMPIKMLIFCPKCQRQHVDEGEWRTKPHRTHQCQNVECRHEWRPSELATVGVREIPGLCHYSKACRIPGPRAILGQQQYCRSHARIFELPDSHVVTADGGGGRGHRVRSSGF